MTMENPKKTPLLIKAANNVQSWHKAIKILLYQHMYRYEMCQNFS